MTAPNLLERLLALGFDLFSATVCRLTYIGHHRRLLAIYAWLGGYAYHVEEWEMRRSEQW